MLQLGSHESQIRNFKYPSPDPRLTTSDSKILTDRKVLGFVHLLWEHLTYSRLQTHNSVCCQIGGVFNVSNYLEILREE